MKKLKECLENKYASYIIPFFWQHGEEQDELLMEIEAIEKSGAKEFCVESRVYEDFCGEKWWIDFKFILDEAKKRNMRVWLLDDKRFPTGYANGSVAERGDLKKKHIRVDYVDVYGEKKDNAVLIRCVDENEKLISVTAYKRTMEREVICGDGIDLTNNISDDLIFWDIPEGVWRIYFVIETSKTPKGYVNYIDMLNPKSCRMQLEAVYEKQYEHFGEYFGNTFAGFFSDEPSFGNDALNYESVLGKEDMLLPWSNEVEKILAERMGTDCEKVRGLLPLLWAEHTQNMYQIRYLYMDIVSMKYKENFSDMLGDWCKEHGVMYIGHVIEDKNSHMRLGYGPGHFFRAMSGQDISGCDIVLNQMIPGIKECMHTASVFGKCVDPEFFTYTLAKLASSDSHIHERKKGRAFCEIFGAFGWAEGIPMMKQLADHMLVDGINYFVPHAFNIKYPDYDCPPHFYIGGKNPQFESFCSLTRYMQRMCHILSDGVHKTDIAVLYNAEAEWCGGKYDLFQKVSKILLQNQIDFDFIPTDNLKNAAEKKQGLIVNQRKYNTLIVSYSEVLPKGLMEALKVLAEGGTEIIFCENTPSRYAECEEKTENKEFLVLKYKNLVKHLQSKVSCDVKLLQPHKYLRYYHIQRGEKDIYMFLNEDVKSDICVEAEISCTGQYIRYDAWKNDISYGEVKDNILKLRLNPSEATIIIFYEHNMKCREEKNYKIEKINSVWKIYLEKNGKYELFDTTESLYNLARKIPRYCGKIKYETQAVVEELPDIIEVGNVGEIVKMSINGEHCVESVSYPYLIDVSGKFEKGVNNIEIEVISNLGYRERDDFSRFLSLPPIGIAGDIKMKIPR